MLMKTLKNSKKGWYVLMVALTVAVSGLVFANHETKHEPPKMSPPTAADKAAYMKKWEATPDGIRFNNWKASPAGKKVLAGAAKLREPIKDSSNIEAVVTALTLPPGSRLGYGVMVRIDDTDYILSFGVLKSNESQPLQDLKVNDRIKIKSHVVSYAPKYAYPIVAGNYVERDGKILYKRVFKKGGC